MSLYTGRRIETVTIRSVGDEGVRTESWIVGASPEVCARLQPGMTVDVETRNFSQVVGWRVDGEWVERKSDEQIEAERQAWLARWEQQKRDRLEASRAEWERREAALPEWVRKRIEHFRTNSQENFDLEGWGYELVIAELAALYDASDLDESDEVTEYARREGSSGNQHDMARALVRAHRDGIDLAGSVSALSPITGKAGY